MPSHAEPTAHLLPSRAVRTIAQRELRNNLGRVLREVEAGEHVRVTVAGRPVADLVPIARGPRRFVHRDDFNRVFEAASLDPGFARDLDDALDQTIDEL